MINKAKLKQMIVAYISGDLSQANQICEDVISEASTILVNQGPPDEVVNEEMAPNASQELMRFLKAMGVVQTEAVASTKPIYRVSSRSRGATSVAELIEKITEHFSANKIKSRSGVLLTSRYFKVLINPISRTDFELQFGS